MSEICPYCQSEITPGEAKEACPGCRTNYHRECWKENEGCGIYGCKYVPETIKDNELDIPPAFWGKDEKKCPSCGQTIRAAALRCRYCGAMFEGQRPVSRREFAEKKSLEKSKESIQKTIIWFLVLSLLTCTAPFATFFHFFWRIQNKKKLEKLSRWYATLSLVAFWAGVAQTALLIFVIFYSKIIK